MLLKRRISWDSQPQEVAPLASGARGQLLFNPALGSRILCGRESVWGYQGNASRILTNRGYAYALDGSGDSLSLTGNDEITGNVGTLAVWLARVGAASLFGHVYIGSQSPNAVAMQITEVGQTQVFGGGLNTGGSAITGWYGSTNRSIVFASGGSAASCATYVDGRNSGQTYTSAPLAWGSGSKTIHLGRYPAGASWDTNADILCAYLTTDVWSEATAAEFHANPWAVVYAPRRIWVPVSAGGGSYTGSLTESASAADASTAAYIATAALTESTSAADSLAAATTWVLSLAEAATAAESITTAGTFAAAIAEAASTTDALTSAVTWARALTEAASASDLATAIIHAVAALTEAASASDSQTTGSIYTGSVAEAASAADALTSVAQWVRLLTEPATAADSVAASAPGIYPVSLAELLEVVDQLVAAFQGLDTPLDAPLFARLAGAAARRVGAASAGATSPRVGRQDIDGSAAH